jgi:hypothetical protein
VSRAGHNAKSAFTPKSSLAVLLALSALLLTALAIVPSGAAAAGPEPFWTRCVAESEADVSCSGPRGIATAPATAGVGVAGNVYVGDSFNRRLAEFSTWGALLRVWGWDVVSSGPGDSGSGFEICVPADGDTCKAGTQGSGAGQFGVAQGVAIDSEGDVYVLDRGEPSNQRVQKFDSEGHFLRMWGGGVNSGTSGNPDVCTNAGPPTDVCKAGTEGSANGQFGELSTLGNYIAIDTLGTPSATDDKVYVGDQGRIQRFDANGAYQSQIAVPGEWVKALAVDPAGSLYASFCGAGCGHGDLAKANVRKWNSAGVEQPAVTVADPQGLAAGPAGELFVLDGGGTPTIRQFTSAGVEVPGFAFKDGFSFSTGIAVGAACHSAGYDLYVDNAVEAPNAFLRAYGPAPDKSALCPPPPHAPEILDQWAVSVDAGAAAVQALISPKFWADTSYYVQYATAACIKDEPLGWQASCVTEKPAPPGAQLGAGGTDAPAKTAKVLLSGLIPATEYRYRFASLSSGGGPVFGKGGTEALDGSSAAFITNAAGAILAETNCPNQVFRSGPSAFLPDCRAYEMVSPVDKNGGDIRSGGGGDFYAQASPDGNRITYSAEPIFGDQPSGKFYNQYLATRQEGVGWSNHGINAPLGRQLRSPLPALESGPFSADLCSRWLLDYNVTPLTPDGQEGYVNLYRQDLCGAGGFEAQTTNTPAPGADHEFYVNPYSVQGFSADARRVFFTARAKLTPDAAPTTHIDQLYEHSGSGLALVSVLPDGSADVGGSADPVPLDVGAAVGGGPQGHLQHAVSEDGSRVFWTSRINSGQSKLYLREHPEQGIVPEECSEASVACTIEVSSSERAIFWAATPSGSTALYSEGELSGKNGTLYSFDVESEESTPLVEGLIGVLGTSEDLSRIYYVSTEALTPGQENSEGDEAIAGKPNLYLDEEGTPTFIATLRDGAGGDVSGVGEVYRLADPNPFHNAARVTPDGAHIAFQSRASLSGSDNTDAASGEPDMEVFAYEAGGALLCVSCNSSGARPSGRQLPTYYRHFNPKEKGSGVWGAAWIPTFEHPFYGSNVLSANGGRLFFNSLDPIVRRDTNGVQDVYEWEAPGEGRCTTESPAFHQANGGCVYLISSGESPFDSTFVEASPDGRDVFLNTESSLLPQDPGHFDTYDARAGGGFAQPSLPPDCEGEGCQSAAAPPSDPTLSSASFKGAGNPKKGAKARCAKGKRAVRRAGKTRCVAKKHKHKRAHKRDANHNRRTAR